MRSIAIINQKGGVGKTTTAVNLAAALTRRGQRVMLVDMDPQGHAGLHLGIDGAPDEDTPFATVYDVLVDRRPIAEVAQFADEKLTIVPSDIHLVGAEVELADQDRREHRLQEALAPHHENYDVLIIDCAPSLGLLTINALAAVREVIIPLQPHFLALQGLGKLLETVTLVRDGINPDLRISGILLCMYDRSTRLAQEVSQDIAGFLESAEPDAAWYRARLFNARIRRNIKLAESPSFGQSIFQYDPASHGAEDYNELAVELFEPADPVSAAVEQAPELPPEPDPADQPESQAEGDADPAVIAAGEEPAGANPQTAESDPPGA